MNPKKQSRRKPSATKLEPIDWREFANDAVLNGNMSTLYRRPPTEDASAYASPEAMLEIEKRVIRSAPHAELPDEVGASAPTVGTEPPMPPKPTVGKLPAAGSAPTGNEELATGGSTPTVGHDQPGNAPPAAGFGPTVGHPSRVGLPPSAALQLEPTLEPTVPPEPPVSSAPTVGRRSTVTLPPTEGSIPTVGQKAKKVKPIRTVHDALTLAGQVLYAAMLGAPQTPNASCTKGYRQLAAETHLDKDTVRDLIVEFKQKGIVHETATYDPDTRLSKTYDVRSHDAVLQAWRAAGIRFVTAGRQRPLFCTASGDLLQFTPTVGTEPTMGIVPSVGSE